MGADINRTPAFEYVDPSRIQPTTTNPTPLESQLATHLDGAQHVVIGNANSSGLAAFLTYESVHDDAVFVPAGEHGSPLTTRNALELVIRHAAFDSSILIQTTRLDHSLESRELFSDICELAGDVKIIDHNLWPNNPLGDTSLDDIDFIDGRRAAQAVQDEYNVTEYFYQYHDHGEVDRILSRFDQDDVLHSLSGVSSAQMLRDFLVRDGHEFPQKIHDLVDITAVYDIGLRNPDTGALVHEQARDLAEYAQCVDYESALGIMSEYGSNIVEHPRVKDALSEFRAARSFVIDQSTHGAIARTTICDNGEAIDVAIARSTGDPLVLAELLLNDGADVAAILSRDGTLITRSTVRFPYCREVAEAFDGRGHSYSGWAIVDSLLEDPGSFSEYNTEICSTSLMTAIRAAIYD